MQAHAFMMADAALHGHMQHEEPCPKKRASYAKQDSLVNMVDIHGRQQLKRQRDVDRVDDVTYSIECCGPITAGVQQPTTCCGNYSKHVEAMDDGTGPQTPGIVEEGHGRPVQDSLPAVLFEHGQLDHDKKIEVYAGTKIILKNLIRLQPLVKVMPGIFEASLVIIEEALRMRPSMIHAVKSNNGGLLALTAAAFWIIAKFGGCRCSTPNAALMSQASQTDREHLCSMELLLLESLDWDIMAVVRRKGLSHVIA